MQERYGQCHGAAVLLHGGAGSWDTKSSDALAQATAALRQIARQGLAHLAAGMAPLDVVVECLKAMEIDERFNAGRGATLQEDGRARLTAALMDGTRQTFSGVISMTDVLHPSLLARHLQDQDARVLTVPGAELLARRLGLPVEPCVTRERLDRWYMNASKALAPIKDGCDTVGCLVRTSTGELHVGTSTGGRGYEVPGRVSDSATVAGTYCSSVAGISATGTGEQIVDDALAARLETRRRDGMTLAEASHRCFEEAREWKRSYGWITVDRGGHWGIAYVTKGMSYIVMGEREGEIASS